MNADVPHTEADAHAEERSAVLSENEVLGYSLRRFERIYTAVLVV